VINAMSCESCVYRDKKNLEMCNNCSDNPNTIKLKFELGKVAPFELARGLAERDNKKREQENQIKLGICPHCREPSWWFNPYTHKHECMNMKSCPIHTEDNQSELTNPMLLSVKMFLADVIHIINRKYEEGHVCADFTQEVYDAATEQGIRCGYVVINFQNSHIGHAIIVFQMDYGLKSFEP
jgi:copper chaperone CopZ